MNSSKIFTPGSWGPPSSLDEVGYTGDEIKGEDCPPNKACQEATQVLGVPEVAEVAEGIDKDGERKEEEGGGWRQLKATKPP